jgi:CRP/FNR family transcriptional regulator, cyclic AMP receptor protein
VKMHTLDQLLAQHPFFAGLDPDDAGFVARCGVNRVVGVDQFLFRAGDRADQFFVVRSGRVAVELYAPGRGPLILDTVGEGAVLDAAWLIPPYRWQFDARAVTTVRLVALDATCLRARCDEYPALGYRLMQRTAVIMQERLAAARVRLLDLYGDPRRG